MLLCFVIWYLHLSNAWANPVISCWSRTHSLRTEVHLTFNSMG
jgi:hypothetical protein